MKKLIFLWSLSAAMFSPFFAQSQCIDESLINPEAICPAVWMPVCGCDNITYGNDCQAQAAGVTEWTQGECTTQGGDCIDPEMIDPDAICPAVAAPVCGCDGNDYINSCFAQAAGNTTWTDGFCDQSEDCMDLAGIDFGECEMAMGFANINGSCQMISGCGWTVDNVDYSPYFHQTEVDCAAACEIDGCFDLQGVDFGFCDFPLGITNIDGTCTMLSGCDWTVNGYDYQPYFFESMDDCNACVNGTDCPDLAGIDFGACTAVLGIGLINGECQTISGCGYVVDGIDYSSYFFQDPAACENCESGTTGCIDPELIDPNAICPLIWMPVCGCDNITYGNDCQAQAAGVTQWTQGECGSQGGCIDPDLIDPNAICPDIWMPVCGCDDITYGNSCEAQANGVTQWTDGECGSQGGCIDPDLIDPMVLCPGDYAPVCGCDSVTYWNGCLATYQYGVSSYTEGPCDCENPELDNSNQACFDLWDPVCGCDSITYSNSCYAYWFGQITSWTPGECNFNRLNELEQLEFNAYPNPIQDVLFIELPDGDSFRLSIYDSQSKLIAQEWIQGPTYQIEMTDLPKGLYMIELQDEALRVSRKKLIK